MKAKLKELREKDNGHIEHELTEKQKHLYELRSQAVTEKLEDPTQLSKARREIARLKTLLRERQLQAAKNAEKVKAADAARAAEEAKAAKTAVPVAAK